MLFRSAQVRQPFDSVLVTSFGLDEVPTSENVNGETKHPHRNRNGVDGAQDCSRYSKPMSPAVGAFRFLQGSNCDERSEWDRPESRDAENREGFST